MLFLLVCISMVAMLETAKSNVVMCYWESYVDHHKVKDIDASLCTHLIYSFAILDKTTHKISTHSTSDIAKYKDFTDLKQKPTKPKILLAIGGMSDSKETSKYSDLVASSSKRAAFINDTRTFLEANKFDGLDMDWEFPKGKADKTNFAKLVKELKTEFNKHPKLLLTAAVGTLGHNEGGYDVKTLHKHLDYINLMAYDFKGWWEDYSNPTNTKANHHSSLADTKDLIKKWTDEDCPKNKLVVGVPLYGRSFTLANATNTIPGSEVTGPGTKGSDTDEAGLLGYLEICKRIKSNGWTKVSATANIGPYAYKGNQWVGYDDVVMVGEKAQYVKDNGYAGVMVWAVDYADHNKICGSGKYPLLTEIADKLGTYTAEGSKCLFPFMFAGVEYNTCAPGTSQPHPWCATALNDDKTWKTWDVCAHPTQGLKYKEGTRYEEIWNDKGSGGWEDVSIWRPSHLASGYCSLGDVAHREYYEPSFKSVSVSGIGVVHPVSFSQVWNDKGSGARLDCAVYKMNAPSGHTCLGGVAMRSHHHQPDRNRYCCIRNDLILNGNATELYKDRGTGANEDLSLWRITKGTGSYGIDGNNFLPVNGYGSPSNPKVLNGQTATKA